MVSLNVSIDADLVMKLDQERRWVGRSKAVNEIFKYVLSQPGTVRNLCGANNIPEEYKS